MQIGYSGSAPTARSFVTNGKCLPTHGGRSTERLISTGLESFLSHHSRLLQLNQEVLKQWQIADTCDSLAKDNCVDFKPPG